MDTTSKPIICRLTTPELQRRKATIIAELRALVLTRRELADGFEFGFDGSDQSLDKLLVFIKTERMCCDFFVFRLTVDENKAMLQITGPEGAKEFLKAEVNL